MISTELLSRVRAIEFHTRKYLRGSTSGSSRSKHKGSGFEFDQIREYQQGDDIRFIDWKGYARSNKLLVRQYNEERSRTIMLFVDGSASGLFASKELRKYDMLVHIATVLALSAAWGQDSVGLIIFSDKIDQIIPPAKGKQQVYKIVDSLMQFQPSGNTNILAACQHLLRIKRRDLVGFILSDFIDDLHENEYAKTMQHLSSKMDLIAVRYNDINEKKLSFKGLIHVQDIETGQIVPLNVGANSIENNFLISRLVSQENLFKKIGVDILSIFPEKIENFAFIEDIIRFFDKRMIC